jgi:hypothetical protein
MLNQRFSGRSGDSLANNQMQWSQPIAAGIPNLWLKNFARTDALGAPRHLKREDVDMMEAYGSISRVAWLDAGSPNLPYKKNAADLLRSCLRLED